MTWPPPPLLLLLLFVWVHRSRAGTVIAPPWVDAQLNPCSSQSWQLVQWPEDQQCYQIYQRGPCGATQELAWQEAGRRPVCSCPSGHLHHAATDRCYRRHTRGPCPRRHFFAEDADTGAVRCHRFGECRPGEIFWPADAGCHKHLTRGPCGKGELLTLNRLTLEPECGCSRRQMARSYWVHTDSCYQEYTRGPCPHGLVFVFNSTRGAVECSCHPRMLENYHHPTGQCHPQGERGPCPPGNTFSFNNVTRRAECRCLEQGLVWPESGACYRSFTQGPCPSGQFTVPRPQAPHQSRCLSNPCQRGELFFPGEGGAGGVCHRIGRRGPCPAGQLVQYEEFRGVSYRGTCGCTRHFTQNFWPPDGRCYEQHTRGPCPQLFTFFYNATSGQTECACESRRGRALYAPSGQCAELYKRGPCPAGQVLVPEPAGDAKCRCPSGLYWEERRQRCLPLRRQRLFKNLNLLRITR